MKIGFIGTGHHGAADARQPAQEGVPGRGLRRRAGRAGRRGQARRHRRRARSAEVAKRQRPLVTMLPSSSHVESVYLGAGGVLEGVRGRAGCAWTCPRSTPRSRGGWRRALRRAAGALHRRAGLRRRARARSTARWPSWSAATPRDLEEARPALAAMGANVIHVGAVGSGEVAKLCNNLIAGVAAVAVSEAFRIAEGFGVDPKILTDVISKSSGNTWVMEQAHPVPGLVPRAASSRDYAPGFMTDLMAKDLGLAVNAARELRVPVLVAPAPPSRCCAWRRPTASAARTSRRSTRSSSRRAIRRRCERLGGGLAPPTVVARLAACSFLLPPERIAPAEPALERGMRLRSAGPRRARRRESRCYTTRRYGGERSPRVHHPSSRRRTMPRFSRVSGDVGGMSDGRHQGKKTRA